MMIITMLYVQGIADMCSAWFLDIRISTCLSLYVTSISLLYK